MTAENAEQSDICEISGKKKGIYLQIPLIFMRKIQVYQNVPSVGLILNNF